MVDNPEYGSAGSSDAVSVGNLTEIQQLGVIVGSLIVRVSQIEVALSLAIEMLHANGLSIDMDKYAKMVRMKLEQN